MRFGVKGIIERLKILHIFIQGINNRYRFITIRSTNVEANSLMFVLFCLYIEIANIESSSIS